MASVCRFAREVIVGALTGWPSTQELLRWPLFFLFGFSALVELAIYIVVRNAVRFIENLSQSSRVRRIREALRGARSYEEYAKRARELDLVYKCEDWKREKQSEYYDCHLLERRLSQLRKMRRESNIEGILQVLKLCIHTGFAGIFNETLYSQSYTGTKHLIETFIREVCEALEYLRANAHLYAPQLTRFISACNSTWGTTALCLSGGGMNCMHHFGVARSLLDHGLLPQVISGASGGAVVASFLCTRTDDELRAQLVPEYIQPRFQCMSPASWFMRFWNMMTVGYMFDAEQWNNTMEILSMGLTFEEAYRRTGRVLNVAVSRRADHSPPTVLNYLNAPHVLISSAVIASSAMPFLVQPQILKEKGPDGKLRSYAAYDTQFMCDGSVDADIPANALSEMWGVQWIITVQVNLHVFPWQAFRNRGSAGAPLTWRHGGGKWRGGFVLSAFEVLLKEHMRLCIRLMALLDVFPHFFDINWGRVFLQDYQGSSNVIMTPRRLFLNHFLLIGKDLTLPEVKWYMSEGLLMVWPKIPMITSRMRIEKALTGIELALNPNALFVQYGLSTDITDESESRAANMDRTHGSGSSSRNNAYNAYNGSDDSTGAFDAAAGASDGAEKNGGPSIVASGQHRKKDSREGGQRERAHTHTHSEMPNGPVG